MPTVSSATDLGQDRPSATLAAVTSILLAVLAGLLFDLAEAGPFADVFVLAFPFVVGGLAIAAARHALRTWRTLRSLEHANGPQRTMRLSFTFLALIVDVLIIGVALLMAFLIVNGPIVQ